MFFRAAIMFAEPKAIQHRCTIFETIPLWLQTTCRTLSTNLPPVQTSALISQADRRSHHCGSACRLVRAMLPLDKQEVDRIIDNNLVDEFDRLGATPGFVLVPMPFEKVQDLANIGTLQSLGQLGRHPQHIRVYRQFRSQVLTEWSSVQDYIQWKVFQWPTAIAQDGRKSIQVPPTAPDPPQIVWRPNDFPYYVEQGIAHDNIWSTKPLTVDRLVEVIERKLGPTRKYTFFINPGPLASIPGVWHAHCMHTAK